MYSLYYKGLRLGVTFQVKPVCVGDFASFAKIFAGFYFGKGIAQDSLKLKGYSYHRADVGEYRIIYSVQEQTLEILLIDKRNDDQIYKQLKRTI